MDEFAEETIFADYVQSVGLNQFTSIFPKRNFDGTQIFRDVSGINTQLFIAFLAGNNPNVNVRSLSIQALMAGGGIRNPDWMIDRKTINDFEFYEVKPKSTSGENDGNKKLLFFAPFFNINKLPYVPGIDYAPSDREAPMWIETKGFIETEVRLRWTRVRPGLILYEVCIDNRLRRPEKVKVRSPADAAAVVLMAMILLGLEAAPGLAE